MVAFKFSKLKHGEMDKSKTIWIFISVVALGLAGYSLISTYQLKNKVSGTSEADLTRPRTEIISVNSTQFGIGVSQNPFDPDAAVELRRGNRLDILGGLDLLDERNLFNPGFVVPDNPFDLSPIDEDAAEKLTANLIMTNVVRPFRPFNITWEVIGPSSAIERVQWYQLNVGGSPIFNLTENATYVPGGIKEYGTVSTSMWKDGKVKLWAHFGSGIKELVIKDITVDLSNCSEEKRPLAILSLFLQTDGANQFVEGIKEEAGEDVTVTVTRNPISTFSNEGLTFDMALKLEGSGATIDVDLEMQFTIVPKAGNLAAFFGSSGYRTVIIDADLPWYDDAYHTITLGEHNISEYYGSFRDGLGKLADGFAEAVGRDVRGLPEPDDADYETLEEDAPKISATRIDGTSNELIVTLCPTTSGLITVDGIFPSDVVRVSQ